MDHKKPTPEELEAAAQKALSDLDNIPQGDPEPDKPEPEPSQPEPEPAPPAPEHPSPPPQEEVDYKKKYTESSRENQIVTAQKRKLVGVIDQAAKVDDISEDELKAKYPDWDALTDFEKKLARETQLANKRFAILDEANKEFKDIDAWNGKVEDFVGDPKTLIDNPELEGKIDDFKYFATKPTRRGADFADLVSAFLYDVSKQPKPKNKGAMFETGSGGPNDKIKPKSDKISYTEAKVLRTNNYKKYVELLRAGKIEEQEL